SGYASPIDPEVDRTELRRQFLLARGAAVRIALDYAAAGFTAVIDDVIGSFAHEPYGPAIRAGARQVLLMPTLDIALERNRRRTNKPFDTAILDSVTRDLHAHLTSDDVDREGWTVIDSSSLSVEETVDTIIARCGL